MPAHPSSSLRVRRDWRGFLIMVLVAGGLTALAPTASAATCTGNAIVCENQLPGTPQSVWDVPGAGDPSIQGYATAISVNVGQTEQFKINTDASNYTITIYRLGYYQGNGARQVATVTPSATLPQTQPACATDATTEIYDCGTWGVSASWTVPSTAVSGVYFARLYRADKDDAGMIPFIVRNDASHSQIVYQTSDPTWQAYNTYGVSDFYQGLANGRAYKVSYNRPFATRGDNSGRDFLFSNEYPMLRFLEQNGYDLSYISGLDTDINGGLLTNHRAFVSVGHDEYWSDGQRTNVEKARDAGVNLAFFSGNEVYWKTRWEPSEDGNSTPNRTLVCYKDTWANAQIDPLGPTSTWRDPRFGGNGKGPENALTGTMYMSNSDDLPIKVSAQEGLNRLWRSTALASQAPGTVTTLAAHTIGYESDEDLDNGFRPAGLIRLSTTTGSTPQYLQDFGNVVAAGTTTHHLTEYRAPSGALVFGAGTIQWAWGVDVNHDGTVSPVDTRIQQATINLLADMGATATTVISGRVAATQSTDTTAPTAVITAPAAGSTIANGSSVTVTGTATDAGGGVPAGVEVSLDGGSTWHPSTLTLSGTTYSFTYTGILAGSDSSAIRARAIDDSANIQSPAATVAVSNGCPCSMFGNGTPGTPAVADKSSVTLGVQFTPAANGYIAGIRFYKGSTNTGTHVGTLYTSAGAVLASATFTNETASGWQSVLFSSAVPVTAGTAYVAAYTAPTGHYAADAWYFDFFGHNGGRLVASGGMTNPNGVYTTGAGFPNQTYQQTNYWVDALYTATDNTPPQVSGSSPVSGSTSNPVTSLVTTTFNRDMDPSSLSVVVKDAGGNTVAGAVSYDSPSRTVTFTPTADLARSTVYTATVNGSSTAGLSLSAPYTFSFTSAQPDPVPGVCPCSLFSDDTAPASPPQSDSASVELGVAFTTDTAGSVTGVRFYKGVGNGGTHTVSLWNSSGTRLATATVTNESTQGWQQALFTSPVAVTANTTYTVSYRAPAGHYSADANGLGSPLDVPPLHTLATAARYTYGSTSSAPTSKSSANYYVDPIVTVSANTAPPTVTSVNPADGTGSVSVTTGITVSFSTAITPGSATITLKNASGSTVAGTQGNGTGGNQATFTPSAALATGTTYTVTVSGATNTSGTPMSGSTSTTFTTTGACPCSLFGTTVPATVDSGDTSAITVGVKFVPSVSGTITGVRYYGAATNTGTHVGTLYSSTGTALASATFGAAGSGWQSVSFATPVAVTAGTTYVAAVYDPAGHYSVNSSFFGSPYVNSPLTASQGVYRYGSNGYPSSSYNNSNYWVDVTFATSAAGSAPTVAGKSPDGSYLAQPGATVSATFAAAIDPSTLVFTVKAGGVAVAGTVAYDGTSSTATFTPSAPLAYGTTFSISVQASSPSGSAMASPATWTFGTVAQPAAGTAQSLYGATDTPANATWPDSGPVNLGVKFTSDSAGYVTAVKFYAGAGNNGPHPVALWSATGTKLGSGTGIGNGTGWQTVYLDSSVAITAGTTYVVSYFAPVGNYAVTGGAFGSGFNNGILHVPASGATYAYSSASAFPGSTSSASYFVDVVVVTSP